MTTRSRLPLALAAAAIVSVLAPRAFAQFVPYKDLPGADEVKRLQSAGAGDRGGRVGEVRWDLAGGTVWFKAGTDWKSMPLAGGAVADGGTPPDAPAKDRGPREPRGGRARQATHVPSPDAKWIAVFSDCNITLEPGEKGSGDKVPVTTDGKGKVWFGSADWVYGEELDQNTAMWWSPDSARLAYYAFDERPVKDFWILRDQVGTRTKPKALSYPKPGDPNPVAKLECYDLASKKRVPIDVGTAADQYVYGVRWTPKGDGILFFRTNRRQDTLDLVLADPATGASRTILTERSDTWTKNSPAMMFLADGRRFVWETRANGWSNFQLWDLDKGKVADLTKDQWEADSIVEIDEKGGWLWYLARSSETKLNPQLHRARLDGSRSERLTKGDHHWSGVRIAPDGTHFVATREFVDRPPATFLCAIDGREVACLAKPAADRAEKLGLPAPEFIRFTAADGVTELYGILWKPPGFDAKKKYPLVIDAYGGPQIVTIRSTYQPVRKDVGFGVLVATCENRGTPGRGKAFEDATYMKLGGPDVDDQAAFVKELSKRGYVDATRVAITGHSYGGFMTLMCMLRHPDLFPVGVAGAPPTDWRQYDTIYTERAMRTPEENESGYDAGSAVKLARNLKGRVMLLHGLVDDNVHPSNTMALADAWQRLDIPFEMMVFPTSDHGIFSPAEDSARWTFILRNFGMVRVPALGAAADDADRPMD